MKTINSCTPGHLLDKGEDIAKDTISSALPDKEVRAIETQTDFESDDVSLNFKR